MQHIISLFFQSSKLIITQYNLQIPCMNKGSLVQLPHGQELPAKRCRRAHI